MRRALTAGSTILVLLTAPAGDAVAKKRPSLTRFSSCTSLLSYARTHAPKVVRSRVVGMPEMVQSEAGATSESAPAPAAAPQQRDSAAGTGGPSFSQTNVQEAGVDEPDIVKTDGRTAFTAKGRTLHAIRVGGEAPPEVLGKLEVPPGSDQLLFLAGDKLLMISTGSVYQGPMPSDVGVARPASSPVMPPYAYDTTALTLIDVGNPAAMRVTRTLTIEGRYVDARMTGSSVRLVIDAVPRALAEPTPEAVAKARTARWLPRGVLRRGRQGKRTFMRLADCGDVRRPPEFSGLDALTVLTIDVARGLSPIDSDAVLTSADTVYSSQKSMYLATQRWNGGQTTQLHKLDVSKPDETSYRGSGEVEGGLLNQFSLSEDADVLRAATTAEDREESESFVTTLAEREGRLVRVGKVGGLGRDERIYSVRFMGERGYVVTFRQTDPLYTLDLSNPAAPRVTGELKILGYSAYLHPVGEDLLLGIGQDATEEGRRLGTQVSLFDVADPANPVRLHARRLGERFSSSEVEYDHKAFLWWGATDLAMLPVMAERFAGAVGVRVTRRGIEEVGRVTHNAEGQTPVRRSLVVGDRLFTLSYAGLKASRLSDLSDLSFVSLGE